MQRGLRKVKNINLVKKLNFTREYKSIFKKVYEEKYFAQYNNFYSILMNMCFFKKCLFSLNLFVGVYKKYFEQKIIT